MTAGVQKKLRRLEFHKIDIVFGVFCVCECQFHGQTIQAIWGIQISYTQLKGMYKSENDDDNRMICFGFN